MTDIQKKLDQLDKYDDAYYNHKPLISDSAYDLFKDSVYRQLPPDHPRLEKVGHDPCSTWPKCEHQIFMGSQHKVSDEDQIRAWYKKIASQVKDPSYVLQYKIDGFSLEIQYEKGKIKRVITRGNGIVGDDITPNAMLFRNLPHVLPIQEDVLVRSEGYLIDGDFEKIQKDTQDQYKNPRNAASGISRRQDGKYCKNIKVMAYDTAAKVKTETETIMVLAKLGFTTVPTYRCKSLYDILTIYRDMKDKRETLGYGIDGLVLKLDDIAEQQRIGITGNKPNAQVALKFESDQAMTKVIDIQLQVGRTGKVTPIAILEPVDLMGSTVQKATLHNFDYISEMLLGINAEVVIEKRGDIIPQVCDIVMGGDEYVRPDTCPSCGSELEFDGVNAWCRAGICKERGVNRITYWVKKLDMKGFSKKFIEKLWDLEKIRSISDIYRLTRGDFEGIAGIGKKTVDSFFRTIESTSEMYLHDFITALGIPLCSEATVKALVDEFETWDNIGCLEPDQLKRLPGFADVSSRIICAGIKENKDMAGRLLEAIKIKQMGGGKLKGKSFCVTGSLTSMPRKKFHQLIIENGGTVKTSVVKGLSYLINNDKNSTSSKNRKAKSLGIAIIHEDDFYEMIGGKKPVSQDTGDDIQMVTENLFD